MIWFFALRRQRGRILKEARSEAELLKKAKLLEAEEHFLELKQNYDQHHAARKEELTGLEKELHIKEANLKNQQQQNQKRKGELDQIRQQLDAKMAKYDAMCEEAAQNHREQVAKLETIAGLSANAAKEQLIQSLVDEAKSEAVSYAAEIIDEAKLNANKEAKRIVIQSIQRLATEAAIENSVTVFHIDSDEVKGKIIGREGRNIRTLEAVTGVEIIVDDTPDAIVLSAFDPVRREVARLALHQLVQDGRIHPARI